MQKNELATIPLGMNVHQIALAFKDSGMFKDTHSQAQAITKIIAGRDYGLGPFASMAGLHVMQGKVELAAHTIAAAIKASGKYTYKVEEKTNTCCRLAFYERDDAGAFELAGVETYDMGDAKRAGLEGGTNYKKFPKNMLFSRCVSNGYRTYCPDIFNALAYTHGELGGPVPEPAHVDAEVVRSEPAPTVTKPGRNGPQEYEGKRADPTPASARPTPPSSEPAPPSSASSPDATDEAVAEELKKAMEDACAAVQGSYRKYFNAINDPDNIQKNAQEKRDIQGMYEAAQGDIDAMVRLATVLEQRFVAYTTPFDSPREMFEVPA